MDRPSNRARTVADSHEHAWTVNHYSAELHGRVTAIDFCQCGEYRERALSRFEAPSVLVKDGSIWTEAPMFTAGPVPHLDVDSIPAWLRARVKDGDELIRISMCGEVIWRLNGVQVQDEASEQP